MGAVHKKDLNPLYVALQVAALKDKVLPPIEVGKIECTWLLQKLI